MTVPGQTMTPREMIDRLIAFDTTSRNSNLELIAWVADYLKGWGIESSLSRDADGHKANLFATIGEKGDGGIVLVVADHHHPVRRNAKQIQGAEQVAGVRLADRKPVAAGGRIDAVGEPQCL